VTPTRRIVSIPITLAIGIGVGAVARSQSRAAPVLGAEGGQESGAFGE
jgi:hypothetical protein